MPQYRRANAKGACYFFTLVSHQRQELFCLPKFRDALRKAIIKVRLHHPFEINGWVLLPDHLHCLWTLSEGDNNFSLR